MAKQQTSSETLDSIIAQFQAPMTDERWPTGIRALDTTLGGGITPGYCYGIYGIPGAGKTTIIMQAMRSLLKQGKRGIYVDVEKSFNSGQSKSFKLDEFIQSGALCVLTIGNFSELDRLITALIANKSGIDFVVIDTITMARASVKNELKVEDVRPGLHAQQASFILNKLKDGFFRNNIASVVIFQSRANIEMGGVNPYAPKYKQAGGFADQHIPDVILKVDIGASIKNADNTQIGHIVKISSDKNKFAPPKQIIARNFYYGRGIPKREEIIDDALAQSIIMQGAAGYFTLPSGDKVHGLKALYELPKETVAEIQKHLEA